MMIETMTIVEAIKQLDPDRDEDWTALGEASMSRMKELTGNPDLKRADVRSALPENFNRSDVQPANQTAAFPSSSTYSHDPVMLLEAATAAAQADRYIRNSALQGVVRAFQVSQKQIRDVQGRLDARIADRKARNEASRAATSAENES